MQKKHMLIIITCLALFVTGLGGAALAAAPTNQSDAVTFSTPEDAITAFFEGVTGGDFGKILEACAVDEISEHFSFDRNIERLQSFLPFESYAPAEYDFYVELNKTQIASRIASQVKILAYSLLSSQELDYSRTTLMDVETAVNFMTEVDPARLSQLEVEGIGLPNPEVMNSDRYKELAVKIALVYGADDSTERVALFSFEGNEYMLGFTLLGYGENWKIVSVTSPIANTSVVGEPVKTTKAEFDSMTQE